MAILYTNFELDTLSHIHHYLDCGCPGRVDKNEEKEEKKNRRSLASSEAGRSAVELLSDVFFCTQLLRRP